MPKSPRGGGGGDGAVVRTHKAVGRPPGSLSKSKSVSGGVGEMPRKRIKMEHGEASKPLAKVS